MELQDNQSLSISVTESSTKKHHSTNSHHINHNRHIYHQFFCLRLPQIYRHLGPEKGDPDMEVSVEKSNKHAEFEIGIYYQKYVVGHAPKKLRKLFYKFLLLPNSSIACEVAGKRINRGGGFGLEIPVKYQCNGQDKAIAGIRNNLRK